MKSPRKDWPDKGTLSVGETQWSDVMRIGVAAMAAVLAVVLSSCAATPNQVQSGAAAAPFGQPETAPPVAAGETEGGALPDDMIASYMNGEESALRARFGGAYAAELRRHQDTIMLTLDADSVFGADSASPKPELDESMGRLAQVLKQYPRTLVVVEAHMDDARPGGERQALTEQRARVAAEALKAKGIAPARIRSVGYGSRRPIAPNTTESGRRENRRITIAIAPIRKG